MSDYQGDYRSREWQQMRQFFEARKATKMKALSQAMLSERESDMLRGAIAECDAILDMGMEPVHVPSNIY